MSAKRPDSNADTTGPPHINHPTVVPEEAQSMDEESETSLDEE